jgi:hypothetical protein
MDVDFKVSKKEAAYINDLLEIIAKEENKELSAKENMIIFYLKRFPNASRADAEKDIDKIISGVSTFTENLEAAKAGNEEWIVDKINETTKDLTNEQKYECMTNLLLALKAVDAHILADKVSLEGFDEEKRFEELKNSIIRPVEGAISEEQIKELEELIKEAAENSGISIAGNSEIIDLIKELQENEDSVKEFVESNWSDADFKGYASFATYISYLEGAVPSIPANTDPEVIAMGVTAGIERDKIIKQATLGEITWEVARTALKVIGFVAVVGLLTWLSVYFFKAFALLGISLFEALLGSSLLGFLAGIVIGGYIAFKATEVLVDLGSAAIEEAGKAYDKVTDSMEKGYSRMSDCFKETIIPGFKEYTIAFWKFINEKILEGLIKIKITKIETEINVNED